MIRIKTMRHLLLLLICCIGSLVTLDLRAESSPPANAGTPTKKPLHPFLMCVWDPIGKAGPADKVMKEVKLIAYEWGVDLNYVIYSDERIVLEEFKLGRCDAANLLGFRIRKFNSFTGSIGALGALTSYDQLGVVLKTVSMPKAADLMRIGDYEIIALGPAGAVFLFTRDRSITHPSGLAGKRMAVIEGFQEMPYIVQKRGMIPVNSSIINSFLKFNNGSADVVGGPAIVYEPFEMNKGLDPNGGIYATPVMFLTMQVVARWDKLPPDVPQKARSKAIEMYSKFVKFLAEPEERIPKKYWIELSNEAKDFWELDHRETRMELAKMNIYDPKTLKLMRRVRCKFEPMAAECSAEKLE